jgi:branched-chain amino acid transport system substrate-binding protein
LNRIAAEEPDVLYLPNSVQDVISQIPQARAIGIEARFLGTDTWTLSQVAELPEAEGAVATHQWHYDLPSPETSAFLDRFRATYDRQPRATAAMTFDAVGLLAEAARRAGSLDPEALRSEIAEMVEYRGATGLISFEGKGDPHRSIVISEIRGGRTVTLGFIEPQRGGG